MATAMQKITVNPDNRTPMDWASHLEDIKAQLSTMEREGTTIALFFDTLAHFVAGISFLNYSVAWSLGAMFSDDKLTGYELYKNFVGVVLRHDHFAYRAMDLRCEANLSDHSITAEKLAEYSIVWEAIQDAEDFLRGVSSLDSALELPLMDLWELHNQLQEKQPEMLEILEEILDA